jgi:D-allulose-6-phosphate 3-epimerase
MDLMHIADQVEHLNKFADEYHADILDWHYCKNMSLAPCFVEGIAKLTNKPIETHLYVDNIDLDLVRLCMDSGASVISMPPEVISRQVYTLKRAMEQRGVGFGVFINPSVGLECVTPYIDIVDRLLIMTVDPGFAGQPFVEPVLGKIAEAAQLRDSLGLSFDIEVDGCCNETWYRRLRDAGADTFVLGGSGLFGKSPDIDEAIGIARNNLARELS